MCQFKSGIILKDRAVVAPGGNDSHTNLLEFLGIEDNDDTGLTVNFVRVELVEKNRQWWINPEEHPEKWKFIVDQDIVPDWFEEDQEKYENMFRDAVCKWWKEHVKVGQEIDGFDTGYYRLKDCKVKELCGNVEVWLDNSSVSAMYDDSRVKEMRGNSSVDKMYDDSKVKEMFDDSIVSVMYDDSKVKEMHDDSIVNVMYDDSKVKEIYNKSIIKEMYGNSRVNVMYDDSRVDVMYGNSIVSAMYDDSRVNVMYDDSRVKEMWNDSKVNVMYSNSKVDKMYGNSTVDKMYGNSIAFNYKNYHNIEIMISEEGKFNLVVKEI